MILFLDFDGVTHPVGCEADQLFCNLERIEAWLRQRPGIEVVISSSWREPHPLLELQGFFAEDMQSRIVGSTPILSRATFGQFEDDSPHGRHQREHEIEMWLIESGNAWQPWAALDDQADLFRPFSARVVICDGRIGLTQRDLEQIDAVLGIATQHSDSETP